MALDYPVDKRGAVNSALAQTGNNQCSVADDGSDEWTVCSPAYERALGVLIEDHGWGANTKVGTLTPSPTPPADTCWDTAFPLPQDLIHIIWVRINQNVGDPLTNQINQPVLYDILSNQLVCNAQGGPPPPDPPQTPGIVTMKYISMDNTEAQFGTPRFILALECFVMSGIYRGLHGDTGEAGRLFQEGELLAQKARTRYDMQKPKRQLGNSRMTASRRVRRPWPQIGNDGGWTG